MINHLRLIALSLMVCNSVALATSALDGTGDSLKSPIHGTAITEESVVGKVVFFEYWGTQCPPCRASLPHLEALQKKYASSGKFTVIGSHVQGKSDATLALLEDVSFPVYQQLRLAHAPCGGGIPHAILFDHRGKLVKQGHPSTLYDQVKELVKNTPARGDVVIIKDVDIKEFSRQVKTLVPGRSIRSSITSLRGKAKQGNEEAQQICSAVDSWIEAEMMSALELIGTHPSQAAAKLTMLSKTLVGLPQSTAIRKELLALNRDPNLRSVQSIRRDIDRIQKGISKNGRTTMTEASIRSTTKKIDALLSSDKISDGIRNEASEMKAELK